MRTLSYVMIVIATAGMFSGCASKEPPLDLQHLQDCSVQVVGVGGFGSGVFIAENMVVTAGHVIDCLPDTVILNDGTEVAVLETYLFGNMDVAFLIVDCTHDFVPLAQGVTLGETVYHIGTPLDSAFFNCLFRGIVCKVSINLGPWTDCIVIDAWAANGCSGGPVFNEKGELVGLIVGGMAYGCGVCETVEHIRLALEEL